MMLGEHSLPSNCTGYQSRFLVFSNTGSIALRLDEVQPPNTVTTPSLSISLVAFCAKVAGSDAPSRSEEHTSELQSLMRISYAVFCLKNKNHTHRQILINKKTLY